MALASGSRLGPYEILAPLGAGGMGEVYRARHTRLGRDVALKVLPERVAKDTDALGRFEREARAVAALSHPNILAIHDFSEEQGACFAVMELLEGQTLRARLGGSTLPWQEACEIGVGLAEGLAAAHAKEIVHRDLKPENVFLTSDGQVKILDFGLARRTVCAPEEDTATAPTTEMRTEPGIVMGTVGYMSPEQVRGHEADARSDIFSLGCVLYEMVTGLRAFSRETAPETLTAILREDPPEVAAIPQEMEAVVGRCLEKDPEKRYQSARDLAFALKTIARGSTLPRPAPARFHPRVMMAASALLLALAVGAYLVGRRPPMDSLAVLPFANVGGDPDSEYLCDGMTESLINSLSQVGGLRVVARATAFRYKGRGSEPQAAGRELKVRAVLTGRVLLRGDSLDVQAELVDVAEGSQLWGQRYNRKLTDILTVQEEVSREITETLRLRLTGEERTRLAKRYTEDTEAYRLYLRGRYHWNKRTGEAVVKGIEYFQQAIEEDPNFALAYSGLADSYGVLGFLGQVPSAEGQAKARAAARRAVDIDETLPEAHVSLAATLQTQWDWAGARREFQRALELNPNYVTAHHWYGDHLRALGRREEALAEVRRALELDPLSLGANAALAWHLHYLGRYDEAIVQCQKTLELDPAFHVVRQALGRAHARKGRYAEAVAELQRASQDSGGHPGALAALGDAYALAGRRVEARELLDQLEEQSRRKYVTPYWMAAAYAAQGEKDQAFEWLEKAYAERAQLLSLLTSDDLLEGLRADPRFQDLLRRVGLAR